MIDQAPHCDDSRLNVLLFGDEQSDEFLDSASHVESCPQCQDRLAQLAAEDQMWSEASQLLLETGEVGDSTSRPDFGGSLQPSWASAQRTASAKRQLECLSPPSHPEMLGRLGRYDVERVIGSGGMGIVLKGFDTELNRPVAVKLLAPHLAHSGAARQRFAREARAAAAIVHEHVVAIHNVETDGETPFLVMQYVAGESLQARVDREGPLDAVEILRIGVQAAAGLAAAHEQGVVHRDIKPANILLEEGVERTLLTDFGLARTVDDASLTHTGIVAGTPHYMSPEQAGGEAVDQRTDLFSLGAVLYFMATGRPPFRAEKAMGVLNRICNDRHRPVWEVNPAIPDDLSDIIDRLLKKRPSRRFAEASHVRQALLHALNRSQRRGTSRLTRLRRFFRRRPWLMPAAAATLGGVAILVAASIFGNRTEPNSKTEPVEPSVNPKPATSWQDSMAYTATMSEVQAQLESLETVQQSTYFHLPGTDWNTEIGQLHSQVDRIEED